MRDDNLGIARGDMPQITGKPQPGSPGAAHADERGFADLRSEFERQLTADGVRLTRERVPASSLRPTQNQMNDTKIGGLVDAVRSGDPEALTSMGKPIYVSRDGRVIDGHHKWAAAAQLGESINVVRLDMGIKEALDYARKFGDRMGIGRRDATEMAGAGTAKKAAPAAKMNKTQADAIRVRNKANGMIIVRQPATLEAMVRNGWVTPETRVQANTSASDGRPRVGYVTPEGLRAAGIEPTSAVTPTPVPETRTVWVNARGGIVANPSQVEIVRGQVTRRTIPAAPAGTGPGRVAVGGTDADRRAAAPRMEGETDRAYAVRTAPTREAALSLLNGHQAAGLRAIAREEGVVTSGSKADLVARLMRVMRDRHADSQAITDMVNRDQQVRPPAAVTVATPRTNAPVRSGPITPTMTGSQLLAQRKRAS